MTVKKLDHVGIIVENLEDSIAKYEKVLGIKLDRIEDYGDGLLKIAFLPIGDVLIELIKPLKPGSDAWDFLQENGEGIEHLAFRVDDLEKELSRVMEQKIPVMDETPRDGAGNTDICFLDRKALNGVLGEFVTSKNK
ncbi:MAG TPA: VOC family protein [Pseudogracilibacillus sp.]|nr:VOC family protein [Pseudogracilibacillus sp.]